MSADNSNEEEKETVPFTENGKYFDEVRLVFDDQQELFVSQNFLMMSSPVFEAMFKNDFKEKQSMTVNIMGKTHADFLEFLMCIHPGTLKPIDETNVLLVAPIAEEYQVTSIVQRCKSYMKTWLTKELKEARGSSSYIEDRVVPARHCFSILTLASSLNYEELVDSAVKTVAKFGHRIYYGSYEPDNINLSNLLYKYYLNGVEVTVGDIIKECRDIFKNLPAELRCEILSQRLSLYRDNDMQ